VAAHVALNTTNSGPNYTTSQDVTVGHPGADRERRTSTTSV
jgi:hypothetical protein